MHEGVTVSTTITHPPQAWGQLPPEPDGFAVASLICGFLAPLFGIIFGHISNHKAKVAGRARSGMAIAGLVLGYIFTSILTLVIIILVAVGASSTSAAATAGPVQPGSSAPAHLSKPSVPPAKPKTLLQASGSGNYTTAKFAVGGNGDYDVHWTYKPGAGFASQGLSANFSVQADNGNDMQFNDPNQLGNGGSGVVHVYGDAGTHYLTIASEADWTITVTAISGQPAEPEVSGAQPAMSAQAAPGTSAKAAVDQFYQDLNAHNYQDLNAHNYQAAWQLGGSNLSGGSGYSTWVADYATTASISASTVQNNNGTVSVSISATQTNGSVKTYAGIYTVANGAIVAANITQTGGPN
jgi:hypothetical protein